MGGQGWGKRGHGDTKVRGTVTRVSHTVSLTVSLSVSLQRWPGPSQSLPGAPPAPGRGHPGRGWPWGRATPGSRPSRPRPPGSRGHWEGGVSDTGGTRGAPSAPETHRTPQTPLGVSATPPRGSPAPHPWGDVLGSPRWGMTPRGHIFLQKPVFIKTQKDTEPRGEGGGAPPKSGGGWGGSRAGSHPPAPPDRMGAAPQNPP